MIEETNPLMQGLSEMDHTIFAIGFLDSIVQNIPDMIFLKDAKHLRFVIFNRAGEELLGYSCTEMIGKSDYDFFPKEEADFFTAKDRAVLAGGKMVDIPEESIHTKYKGTRILHTKKIPILDTHGTPVYLLGISEDITDRKNAEKELQKAIGELKTKVQEGAAEIAQLKEALQKEISDRKKAEEQMRKHNAPKTK